MTLNSHDFIIKDIPLPHTVSLTSALASKARRILGGNNEVTYELLIQSEHPNDYATQVPANSMDSMSLHSHTTLNDDRPSTPGMI